MPNTSAKEKAIQLYEADLSRIGNELAKKVAEVAALRSEERELRSDLAHLKKRTGDSKKPAARKDDVVRIAKTILEAGPMTLERLKEEVATKLRKSHTLAGFALRFKEAMATTAFFEDQGRVTLAANNPSDTDGRTTR